MTKPSTYEALTFLDCISPVNTSIFTKTLSCPRTYVAGTLTGYTVKKIMRAWISLLRAAGMRPLSKMDFSLCLFARKTLLRDCQGRYINVLRKCMPMILQKLQVR